MFCHTRLRAILCLALLGLIGLASSVSAAPTEPELLATLNNKDAALFDKALACKQLAVVGTEAAVPVLAALLNDEKLAHYARFGLEPIPSPKVDAALLAALGKLKGTHLVGAINSIANRGKPEAIDPLAGKLGDADPAVASAAAHAIARLGTPKAGQILTQCLSENCPSQGERPSRTELPTGSGTGSKTLAEKTGALGLDDKGTSYGAAAAALVCAKTLSRQGHTKEAVDLLVKLRSLPAAPEHVRLAALLQAIQIQKADGLALLGSALTDADPRVFQTGLRTARLIKPSDAVPTVLATLPKATPARRALLVTLLGDLADPACLPAVLEAAQGSEPAVRIAALEALATLGSAAQVTLLIDAASDKLPEVSEQAQKTLAALSGAPVDQAVLAALDDQARRAMAIRLIGQRRITAALPKLLALLDGPDRLEVVTALGETISLTQLDVLGKLLASDSADVRKAACDALHTACSRMPDRDATATWLAAYLKTDAEEILRFVTEELRRIGGPQALATVAQAAKGPDGLAKDLATQALGEWLDISAAPVLLDLAKAEDAGKYGVRGLRGYVRLARQFSMPEEERLAMCRTALATAQRDSEKKLVLEVLQRNPSLAGLKLVAEVAENPALAPQARVVAMTIGEKVGHKSAEVQRLLMKIGHDPVKIEIVKAEYGTADKVKDVSDVLRKYVRDYPLIDLPKPSYNASLGGDPVPGKPKQLKIQYRMDGKPGEVTFKENAPILLPTPK